MFYNKNWFFALVAVCTISCAMEKQKTRCELKFALLQPIVDRFEKSFFDYQNPRIIDEQLSEYINVIRPNLKQNDEIWDLDLYKLDLEILSKAETALFAAKELISATIKESVATEQYEDFDRFMKHHSNAIANVSITKYVLEINEKEFKKALWEK